MKHVFFAAVTVLGLATAIPAFADSGDNPDRTATANSLPSGFYDHTPGKVQAQIEQNYFAAQQAKNVAKAASAKALGHVG